MTITFYSVSDAALVVDKTLGSPLLSLSGAAIRAKSGCSILDPVIEVATANAVLYSANYCYIQEYGRYYYVNAIRDIRTGLMELSMHVDVLMTYAAQIRGLSAIIARQESAFNLYLPDGAFKALAYPKTVTRVFPNPLSGANNLVLVVAGGDDTSGGA